MAKTNVKNTNVNVAIASIMASRLYQHFAIPLAKYCQYSGKVLPIGWQSLAKPLAKKVKVILQLTKSGVRVLNKILATDYPPQN